MTTAPMEPVKRTKRNVKAKYNSHKDEDNNFIFNTIHNNICMKIYTWPKRIRLTRSGVGDRCIAAAASVSIGNHSRRLR